MRCWRSGGGSSSSATLRREKTLPLSLSTVVVFECPRPLLLLLATLSVNRQLEKVGFMTGFGNVPVWSRVLNP